MSYINRAAFIITTKEAYAEWALSLDNKGPDKIDPQGNLYLVPSLDYVAEEDIRKHLKRYWKEIAEEEFFSWCTDPTMWPKMKTILDFEKYFAWEYREMLFDLVGKPILNEDDEDF